MSLINQMLRDLENRRSRPGAGEGMETVSEPDGHSTASKRVLWLATGGLLLIAMTWFALQLVPAARRLPQAQPVTGAPQAVTHEIMPRVPKRSAAVTPESKMVQKVQTAVPVLPVATENRFLKAMKVQKNTAVPLPESENSSSAATGNGTATLLDLAALQSVGSLRLVLEFGQLPEYRVLQDGSNGKPVKLVFKRTTIGKTAVVPAQHGPLLKSIRLVPEHSDLLLTVMLNASVQLQDVALPADTFHGHRLLLDLNCPSQAGETVAPPPKPAKQRAPATDSVPQVKKLSRPAPPLSKTEQAEQAYRVGLKQLDKHDRQAAEKSFSRALSLDPQALDARLQLVGLLQQLGRGNAAERQLRAGLQLQPSSPELRKKLGRLLFGDKRLDEAIHVLSVVPQPAVASDLEYHALLAAMLQEAGNYTAAAIEYEKLLVVKPREALWWMGLGIALEQTGAREPARRAYQRALQIPGLRPELENYIRDRLQVL